MFSLIAYIIVGVVSGFLAGLLGISGGLVTIPCLLLIFHFLDFAPIKLMQLSIGTSLAAMIFNSLTSALFHHRKGGVLWEVVKDMAPGLLFGCILGAFLGQLLSTSILQLIFALFAILIGIRFAFDQENSEGRKALPSKKIQNLYGFGIGALSNILGIGGGTMTIPLFVAYKIPMKKAVGTSAATGLFITSIGAIGYLIFGFGEAYYPNTLGYIYLPAFGVIAVTTFFTAPYGALLTHRFSAIKLKRYFAVIMFLVGISMLLKNQMG